MYQQTIIIGNIGRDPELNYTSQGIAVLNFSVAVNKVTGSEAKGNRKESTDWFRVAVWRERAESLKWLQKGMRVMVIGEVKAHAYLDKEGKPAASLELSANELKVLSSKNDGASSGGSYYGPAAEQGEPEEMTEIPF